MCVAVCVIYVVCVCYVCGMWWCVCGVVCVTCDVGVYVLCMWKHDLNCNVVMCYGGVVLCCGVG